jgi:hypothetical protein
MDLARLAEDTGSLLFNRMFTAPGRCHPEGQKRLAPRSRCWAVCLLNEVED